MSGRYGVKDVFITLQGEGSRAGSKSVFVRFSGCNLWSGNPLHRDQGEGPCAKWCDTDFFKGKVMSTEDLVNNMLLQWGPDVPGSERWCVITGGEPALQVDAALVDTLHGEGWRIAVETNGTVDNDAIRRCDHVCISPKHGTAWRTLGVGHEFKVILPGAIPGEPGWTEEELLEIEALAFHKGVPRRPIDLFVQPQDPIVSPDLVETSLLKRGDVELDDLQQEILERTFQAHLNKCTLWVMQHPRWRLSIQTHKLMGLP